MAYIIGSARIDEKGNAVGGASGDQTGREVCTENFYMHSLGWYAYKAKDANVAKALATAMKQACDNPHIGYDQNARLGVITQLKKYGTLAKIAVNTECDCSSLVRACCIQAGFDPGNFTTYNEGKALEATGKFGARISVTSSTKLETGMILVTKSKGHTVIVTQGETPKQTSGYNKTPQWVGMCNTALLNVRSGPGVSYPNIKKWPQLAYGNKVDVCDERNGWYYIRIAGSIYGFVSAQFISRV